MLGVLIASWRLSATRWTDNLIILQLLFTLATGFGLALGFSRFHRLLALFFAVAYGSFFIPWQLGSTIFDDVQWQERLISLWGRINFSIGQLVGGENVEDPILFLALMGILVWLLGINAGYMLMRHRKTWLAILPIVAFLVILHTYDVVYVRRVWYLAFFLAIALLLVSRGYLLEQRDKWRQSQTQMPIYIGQDMLRATALAAGVLVLLAWITPALAANDNPAQALWDTISAPWREFRREFGRAFYSLDAAPIKVNDYYGQNLALGRGNALASTIVMTAQVSADSVTPPRFYWRDRVYTIYENGGWQSGFDSTERVDAGDNELIFESLEGRAVGSVQITSGRNIQLLHTPTQPISISRNADFYFSPNPDGTWDISALKMPFILRSGESYQSEAYFTNASVLQLQSAGNEYPAWVTERYLQIPPEISTRTLELAEEIAGEHENAFDIATAVTEWLRANIDYVDLIDAPPEGFEPIDWMLFEQQEAFCNYYATAEIIMLRSLGIPARLAVGYAEGDPSESNLLLTGAGIEKESLLEGIALEARFYTVRQEDAHAWPEVYFPGIGWVEFEPTVNQTVLIRPLGLEGEEEDLINSEESVEEISEEDAVEEALPSVLEGRLAEELALQRANTQRIQILVLSLIAVLLSMAVLWRRFRARGGSAVPVLLERGINRMELKAPQRLNYWSQYTQLEEIPRAFMEINSALRRIGAAPGDGDTPKERANALSRNIPRIEEVITDLSNRYERSLYKEEEVGTEGVRQAKWTIRLASYFEKLRGWLKKWQEIPVDWRERLGKKPEESNKE